MSQLTQEIQEIFGSVVSKRPIYKLTKSSGWRGDSVSFKNTTSSTSTSESFLKNEVMGKINYDIDFNTGTVTKKLDSSIDRRIRSEMLENLIKFICQFSSSSNPKLTTFYKWYKAVGGRYEYIMNNLPDAEADKLEDLFFNVWKFTKTSCNTSDQRKNAIKILEFINAKYELRLKDLL